MAEIDLDLQLGHASRIESYDRQGFLDHEQRDSAFYCGFGLAIHRGSIVNTKLNDSDCVRRKVLAGSSWRVRTTLWLVAQSQGSWQQI